MSSFAHATLDPSSLAPPQQGGLLRAVGLALVAHALLLAALTWGVNWKSQEAPAVEAEIWSSVRQQAAPRAVEPPPTRPEPEPPQPQPKPEPTPPPAPTKATPPPDTSVRDAQIALERDKKERERKERELAEKREQQRKAEAEKRRQEELADAKREAQKKAEAKAEAQKREAEQERREEAAAEAKRKQQAAAKAAQEQAAAEARRQENIRRMQGLAGASGGATATGSALQSTGPSASYGSRVAARVRPNITFADSVPGNPAAEVEVRTAPDGTIVGKRLVKSSGNKAWDEAVLRAIDKTETVPRDTDGRVPGLMVLSFRRND